MSQALFLLAFVLTQFDISSRIRQQTYVGTQRCLLCLSCLNLTAVESQQTRVRMHNVSCGLLLISHTPCAHRTAAERLSCFSFRLISTNASLMPSSNMSSGWQSNYTKHMHIHGATTVNTHWQRWETSQTLTRPSNSRDGYLKNEKTPSNHKRCWPPSKAAAAYPQFQCV